MVLDRPVDWWRAKAGPRHIREMRNDARNEAQFFVPTEVAIGAIAIEARHYFQPTDHWRPGHGGVITELDPEAGPWMIQTKPSRSIVAELPAKFPQNIMGAVAIKEEILC